MYLHIISRSVAKQRGFRHFYTGELCKNGHLHLRNTKSSTCLTCDKERKEIYRKENPEKARETCRKSRLNNLEVHKESAKRWREKNAESLKISKRQYVLDNREKVAETRRKYYQENKEKLLEARKIHRLKNIDKYRKTQKEWREQNRERVRTLNRLRKDKIKKAEGTHTAEDVLKIKSLQKNKCAACYKKINGDYYHVDHIQPIALGGTNWPNNLQILCPTCNMSKGAKQPEEYYNSLGYLL